MPIKQITVKDRRLIADGSRFGEFGQYEAVFADVTYEVDPRHHANQRIVDIHYAPTNAGGCVEFNGNLILLRPTEVEPTCLLVDVPNRGNRITTRMFNRVSPADALANPLAPGDGFLYNHGFSVAAIGWQFDVQQGMFLRVPNARIDGEKLKGDVVCQMQTGRDTKSLFFGQTLQPTYRPTGKGRLYQRTHTRQDFEPVSDERWRFGRIVNGEYQSSDQFICSEEGFQKGAVYTLVYETIGAPIVGLGLLALRDATAYLRYDGADLGSKPINHTIGFGASQTGRVLRHFVYEGLNRDELNRPVFDAVIPHIAGGQRGDFNHRFAQPGSMGVPAAGQRFPFSAGKSTDALTHREGSLREHDDTELKIVSTNTSWEYWRGDAALNHVETNGKFDIELPENERAYMFAGTHHINGVLPLTDQLLLNGEQVSYPLNTISYTPLIRAVLINTLRWIVDGIEPPASKIPRLSDSTLVDRSHVIKKFTQNEQFPHLPDPNQLTGLCFVEQGSRVNEGICDFPGEIRGKYPTLVSDINEGYNETAGVRLPEIELGIGIHSGWNPRHKQHGASEQTSTFAGFSCFYDLARQIPSKDELISLVKEVTSQLITSRYVLDEDRQLVIDNALNLYDIGQDPKITKPQE